MAHKGNEEVTSLIESLRRFLESRKHNEVTIGLGVRGPAVGGKKTCSKFQRNTEVAAIFYNLIESAKLCGMNPKKYLLAATKPALENPG